MATARVARLVTAGELLRLGYGVPRYVSVEQQIVETKNGYYAALYESQRDWHEGEHTIWPWTEYLVGALAETYRRFEAAAERGAEGMSKQDRVRATSSTRWRRALRLLTSAAPCQGPATRRFDSSSTRAAMPDRSG
jgi:hypothetical protein